MASAQSSEEYLTSKKKDIENLELQIETIRVELRANLAARREAIENGQFEEYDILDERYKELDARFMRFIASLKEIQRHAASLDEAEVPELAPSGTVQREGVNVESEPREQVPVPENPPEKPEAAPQLDIDIEEHEDPVKDQ